MLRSLPRAVPARLTALIAVAALLAACQGGGTAASASSGGGGTTIDVTLTEYEIVFSPSAVPAGAVTFDVTNDGTVVHEFVVFKTDLDEEALPEASGEDAIDESASELESMGEVEDVEVGGTKSFTATLEPGDYVAICNVVGHYGSGMHLHFTVS